MSLQIMFSYKNIITYFPRHCEPIGEATFFHSEEIAARRSDTPRFSRLAMTGNILKYILMLICCILLSACIDDEDINGSGCINGKVVNEQGEPIADVNLQLINQEGTSPYNGKITFTDQGGNYAFQGITPADNYMLIATHPDYETDTSFVNIFPATENECASENISLSLLPKKLDGFILIGERGNSKYYLSKFNTTWPQANDICNQLQVHLVTINSQTENDFLVNVLQVYGGVTGYWIGLSDAENEEVFQWVTGEPLDFINWAIGEPNNSLGDEDFGGLYLREVQDQNNGKWNDFNASEQLKFIAEKED